MSKIRFGIIGAGAISQGAAIELAGMAEVEVVAIADPSLERANALADKAKIVKRYASGEELIADPAIDAVYVAVPNKYHAPLAAAALKAGKHVILDKPFALSLAEAEGVAAAAKSSGKLLMLGMNQRFAQPMQRIRRLVMDGVLGEVYHGKACWMRRAGSPKQGTWFTRKELAGGGALLDIGVHVLDLGCWLMGNWKPVAVTGRAYTKLGQRGLGEGGWGMSEKTDAPFDVDDFATALITFADGATLSLDASWVLHQKDSDRNGVQLHGSEGGATTNPCELFRFGDGKGSYRVDQNPFAEPLWAHGSRFRNFVLAILGKEAPAVTVAESLVVQKIIDGIYESTRTGREVRLG